MATSKLTKYLVFLLFLSLAFSSQVSPFPPPSGTDPDAGIHGRGTRNLLGHGEKGPLLCKPLHCHTPSGFCGVTLINFEPQPCSHGYQNQ
ncbi:hypothetical protein VNO80_28670 [Phaseolus coccineus]|uniref:Uncharacterized protein n=1 Tax=Phaseolus coccineus TaxID=3886 RepID=A0AAN9QBP3_PHACN